MSFGIQHSENKNKMAYNFVKFCVSKIENFDLLKKYPFRNILDHITCQNKGSHVFKEQC